MSKVYLVADPAENIDHARRYDHLEQKDIEGIQTAICALGYECEVFGGVERLVEACNAKESFPSDALFLNLTTGLTQRHRKIQAPVLLELLGVHYGGADPFSHALANNKHFSKLAVADFIKGCTVPVGILLTREVNSLSIEKFSSFPAVVKPNCEGSSIGIAQHNLVRNLEEAVPICAELVDLYDEAVLEEYIPGADITCFVLGNPDKFLLVHSLVYKIDGSFHQLEFIRDFDTKFNGSVRLDKIPMRYVPEYCDMVETVESVSKNIFSTIGCRDIARIDFRITPQSELYFLEINALPMLDPTNPSWMSLDAIGITFPEFIEMYIESIVSRGRS